VEVVRTLPRPICSLLRSTVPTLFPAQAAVGKELGPIENAMEYSIVVGDFDGDVTNADLINFFRNPNLGLRGDLIDPFHSCYNTKDMVDSKDGDDGDGERGERWVRFLPPQ
jgi:hypothetical protein